MKTLESVTNASSNANRHNTLTQRIVKWAAAPVAVLALAGCAKEETISQKAAPATSKTTVEAPATEAKPTTSTTVLATVTTKNPLDVPMPPGNESTPPSTEVVTAPPTSANHPANPSKQISVDSFEGLILGLTVSDLSKKGYRESPACGSISLLNGPSGTLYARIDNKSGYVDQYSTQDPSVTTLSGVHVGSSRQDVMNAYGKNITVKPQSFGDGTAENLVFSSPQALSAQDSGVNIDFLVNNGAVSAIAMTRPGVEPTTC